MVKKRDAIIGNVILFIISLVCVYIAFLLPRISNTDSFTQDNTFMHIATVDYTEVDKDIDSLKIHIKENKQTLGITLAAFKNKPEILNQIKSGDVITFWTYLADMYDLPDVSDVTIWALSVNDIPVITIEELNRGAQKSMTNLRTLCIVIVAILESIGVFLLIRAFKKPKDKSNQNPQT